MIFGKQESIYHADQKASWVLWWQSVYNILFLMENKIRCIDKSMLLLSKASKEFEPASWISHVSLECQQSHVHSFENVWTKEYPDERTLHLNGTLDLLLKI